MLLEEEEAVPQKGGGQLPQAVKHRLPPRNSQRWASPAPPQQPAVVTESLDGSDRRQKKRYLGAEIGLEPIGDQAEG